MGVTTSAEPTATAQTPFAIDHFLNTSLCHKICVRVCMSVCTCVLSVCGVCVHRFKQVITEYGSWRTQGHKSDLVLYEVLIIRELTFSPTKIHLQPQTDRRAGRKSRQPIPTEGIHSGAIYLSPIFS